MANALQAKMGQAEIHKLGRGLEELLEEISVNNSICGRRDSSIKYLCERSKLEYHKTQITN